MELLFSICITALFLIIIIYTVEPNVGNSISEYGKKQMLEDEKEIDDILRGLRDPNVTENGLRYLKSRLDILQNRRKN